ncbi:MULTISPECIES: biotin carboxylase N-terminal domain-containing protein [Actinotignum]|nr:MULTISPECIES: biotin carboxylase N-terminal domain-containing protein [Actinotignum]MDE1558196.1 biotin carboxylase N-terminal domain-containing protein [Actinotignum schaalii]MDE1663107.1 biotin carboxylase N-terminal domain-containing protein [Actinotignum schaalii]MDK6372934.1 biotin carboxylase N-terminal domain-containing protein [Actinotignum timonense]MDK6419480.1 biotin carboxylase N-terminal domain-containing protein [Actinotignum timonense]MDK6590010.1 biotin carboxylase N-termina
MKKILVANRSEIAERVIRTAHDMGMKAVAVYADADREAQFVEDADSAYALEGTAYADTYMNIEKIIAIAQRSHADAVHPGYGFLSEVPEFATAVIEAGLTWIGPAPAVLHRLGDKIQARRLAESVGVAPVPGVSDPVQGRAGVDEFVARFGFPIVTKKADGGGGRGITIHNEAADLDRFFAAHGADLDSYFVERFIRTARHIETQSARDSHGNFAVISTRDCSAQRRNQKLIEEAPAPLLPGNAEAIVTEWSRRLFEAVDYVGLGTCEFLVEPDGRVNFLEVNPRLQVEHTVSEEVTGMDLVREQILIASGAELSEVPAPRAHSFEFRITCEDPATGMVPSTGTIEKIRWPLGHGVRIESGIEEGDIVTADFDPMLAKLVVTAPDREQAIARSRRALAELQITGVATPCAMYRDVLAMEEFAGHIPSTRWLEDTVLPAYENTQAASTPAPVKDEEPRHTFVIEVDGRRMRMTLPAALIATGSHVARRTLQPRRSQAASRTAMPAQDLTDPSGMVNSPIQAIVVRVVVEPGDKVHEGDLLVVLESMKMESYVYSPRDGEVTDVEVRAGATVAAFQPLVRVVGADA